MKTNMFTKIKGINELGFLEITTENTEVSIFLAQEEIEEMKQVIVTKTGLYSLKKIVITETGEWCIRIAIIPVSVIPEILTYENVQNFQKYSGHSLESEILRIEKFL